jgi:hypothetical protein
MPLTIADTDLDSLLPPTLSPGASQCGDLHFTVKCAGGAAGTHTPSGR